MAHYQGSCCYLGCHCNWCVSRLCRFDWFVSFRDRYYPRFCGWVCGIFFNQVDGKNIPGGLDLISIIIVGAPLTRFLAQLITPVINSTLLTIGDILTSSVNSNPIIMGMILGGTIVVVATAPLSSMALTAMLGLTGIPMAIGALSVFGSSFMNGVLFTD